MATPYFDDGLRVAVLRIDVLNNDLLTTIKKLYNLKSVEIIDVPDGLIKTKKETQESALQTGFKSGSADSEVSTVTIAQLASIVNERYVGNHTDLRIEESIQRSKGYLIFLDFFGTI